MFILAFAIFLLFLIIDAAISAAVIYHLRQYTMSDWNAARIVIPAYLALAILFALLAMYELWSIPFDTLPFGTTPFDIDTFLPSSR